MGTKDRIQFRCSEEARREWDTAKALFDLTHEEFAQAAAEYVKDNEAAFRRKLSTEERNSDYEERGD
jgi:hypothetical protein